MHNNCNDCETVIVPQTIIVPTKSIIVASLYCALCTVFTLKPVGWSLQVTLAVFTTEITHFNLESFVKHVEIAKHKKRRDMCVEIFSGSSGSIVKAFNRQDTYIGVSL